MDDHTKTTMGGKEQPEEERQDRRQFFNGLGKWSLAIIAAVAALREGVKDVGDGIGSRFGTNSEATDNTLQQIAKHGNEPHQNIPPKHGNSHSNYHGNFNA